MILIDNIIVADDIVEEDFVCNIKKCKGACCWEGDFGAPLEEEEMGILDAIYSQVAPYLPEANKQEIEKNGLYKFFDEPKEWGTNLMEDGSCVFLTKNELGISQCGIEKAHEDGKTTFKKPISCELYPIRVDDNAQNGFTKLEYDRWEVCSNLCQSNKSVKVPLYQFVKNALVRKFGSSFFEQLEGAAKHSKSRK